MHQYRTKGPGYRRTVQTTLKASHTGHYRKGLIELLEVLEFRSNNSAHRAGRRRQGEIRRYAAEVIQEIDQPEPDQSRIRALRAAMLRIGEASVAGVISTLLAMLW